MPEKTKLTVSIIIKALNEERRIADAIESALAALQGLDGEVILADGGSRDRTIELARRYPIKIVQLNNIEDRTCGAGAQLGYQYSSGRYLCLMDGDMELHGGFLQPALRLLEENPALAGVGGLVIDRVVSNLEFEQRTKRYDPDTRLGPVTRLNSSGLYRRSAIESIGYVTDRNLHGGEELDLAARLHAKGWTLARTGVPMVDHYGHTGNAYRLLLRRVAAGNASTTGELFRAAIGRPYFWHVVAKDKNTLLCLIVAGWWAAMAGAPFLLSGFAAVLAIAGLFLLPFAAMSLRWRSLRLALYSVAAWNAYAASFLPGLMRSRVSPTGWIDSTLLQSATPSDRRSAFAEPARAAGADKDGLPAATRLATG
jgi:glycosyltransferase involved in cell wall biosynthesis